MLNDATGFKKVYIATEFTDLRKGIESLASMKHFEFHLDPYDKGSLFLFCGKKSTNIKGLILEGDGFLLVYIMMISDDLATNRKHWKLRLNSSTC